MNHSLLCRHCCMQWSWIDVFVRCRKKYEVCYIDWPGDVGLSSNGRVFWFVDCCCLSI